MRRRRAVLMAKLAYLRAQYLLARHAGAVLLALLQRAYPNMPWKNLEYAARRT